MKRLLLAMGAACLLALPQSVLAQSTNATQNTPGKTITGKVLDDNGRPLVGATVQVKNSNESTVTESDGSFRLDVPANAGTLVISFVGMESRELSIGSQQNFNVSLTPDAGTGEVIVIGYGTQKKINLTGAVAAVSGDKLIERPAPNAANLLQGRIAGLQVIQPSGEPGRDNPNLLIRGRGTFGGSNAPLVLIDGVTGNINNLSPDDIENVTVLKDAASAAIYGARAANGVILVTTKKGVRGRPTISYRANFASHNATQLPDFITNSADYMTLYNQAAERSGAAFRYPQAEIDKYRNATDRSQYPNFDFVDYYVNPAFVTNHNLSLSGGTDKSTYNISLGYLDQDAMLPGYKFRRYNILLNYSNQVTKNITAGTIVNFTYKTRKEPPFTSENLLLTVFAAGPTYGPYLPDGSGRPVSRAYLAEGRNRTPSEYYVMGEQNTREYNMNAQAYVDIKLFKGLTWSSKAAVNYVDEFYKMHQRPYQAYLLQERDPVTGDYAPFTFGPDILGVTDQYSKTITPTIYSTLNYDTRIANDHHLQVLAGYEQLSHKFQTLRARRINTAFPVLNELTGYSTDNQSLFFTHPRLPSLAGPSEWAMRSVFGRLNYNYKGRYLLEGNLRYDGTSKVSPDFRWGLFPSVSAGWVVSEENFLRDRFNWLGSFKIRGSYGTLGNQDIGTYLYQNNITINNVFYPFNNSSLTQGGVVNSFKDQSLRWETTTVTDIGFDLNLRKGLLAISFDWFEKTTSNILASQPIPLSVGLSQPTVNNGKLRNRGVELDISHQNRIGEFNYGINGNFSTARNKLLEIPISSRGTTINEVGLPYGSHFLYVWDGIFQTADIGDPKVPRHSLNPNPKPGDLKMKDIDGDGDVDADDRIVVDGAYPDFIYSFGFNVSWKGFYLSTFFQGVEGIKSRVNNWGIDPFQQGTAPTTKWLTEAWTPSNPTNSLPAIYIAGYSGVANYSGSTYYLQDASYLRCKNVLLSYTLPRAWVSSIKASDLTVYVSADNLFTFTQYEGADPERTSISGNFVSFPQARIFNAGLNIKF